MSEPKRSEPQPPAITRTESGELNLNSAADIVEFFLNNDERTARLRHPRSDELFTWKQQDDKVAGVATYPFENAEARFAIGCVQALRENDSEPLLKLWISDVLDALQESRKIRSELVEAYSLNDTVDASPIDRSQLLPTTIERRSYLTSCWLETLLTAEARVLGWIYQDLYGKPFAA